MASRRFFDGAQSELGLLPVGDGGPGDTGLTFTDPTLFYEPFTGTNGDPWDGDWADTYTGAGTSVTIQGNKGRIASVAGDAAIRKGNVTLPTDYEITYNVTTSDGGSNEARCYFATDFASTGNGHYLWTNPGTDVIGIGTVVTFTTGTALTSTTYTHTTTDTLRIRIKVRGTSCKVRVWKNSEDEPLDWQLSTTLTYTFDELHLAAEGISVGSNVEFDDLYVWTTRPVQKGTDTSWAGSGDLLVLRHANPTWTGDVKVIIWKHGGIGGNAEEVDSWTLYPEMIADANGRLVLYAADDGFGGNGAAGNDTELASLDAVYARAQTDYPEFPKVALAAHSLGGMGIVNWAYRNDTDVAGMIGVDVILDAAQQNTNDGGSFVTNVLDPAYGGGGTWSTNASTRDPEDLATASAALRAIPFEIYDATGDSVLSSNVMDNYATAHGANATVTDIASGDHGTVHNFIDVEALITEIQTWTFTGATTLAPADMASASTIDNVTLTQTHTLTVADTASSSTIDNLALTQDHQLVPADLASASTLDAVALTQDHQLVPADLASAATIDNLALTQDHQLAVADMASATTIDNVTLGGADELDVADMASATTIDAVALTQDHQLAVADTASASTIDNVALTQDHQLVPADMASASTIDNVTLGGADTLDVADLASASTIDAVVLTQTHILTVGDVTSSSTIDAVVLVQTHVLSPDGVTSSTTIDAVVLSQDQTLALADLASATTLDSVNLTQTHILAVGDLAVATTLDSVVLYGLAATITGRLRTRRADTARTTGRGDTARTTRRSDTPRTTRGDGR